MPVHARLDGGIAILTLSQPARRNALDGAAFAQLRDAARGLPDVRAVVVTGEGSDFSSGLDLSADNALLREIAPAIESGDDGVARRVISHLKDCVAALAELEVPTFAAIEGACVGGGLEIALACDVRIAARSAALSLPEVRMGMIPDVGGCTRLARLLGPGRAADLICTARRVGGEEAFGLGLVERLCDTGQALPTALAAARAVCENGPQAVRLALAAVRVSADLGLDEALSVETNHGALALTSGEAVEGIRAFRERRAPRW
ncbi:MAG: enoyl-CoA hydratase/isomerase family protein [Deltaproteobacteria bacterium]|nr:enoyl-CoA hydratase/isomerase family protein [Deltaproteobacteria bacterium]